MLIESMTDLCNLLKTEMVLFKDLRVGDIVSSDFPFMIGIIEQSGDGTWEILDEFRNGTAGITQEAMDTQEECIVDRSVFDPGVIKRTIENIEPVDP